MGVVSLPGGEEHGQHRHEGRESTYLAMSIANGCHFEHTRQCAIERIDSVTASMSVTGVCEQQVGSDLLEQLTQRT
jgi:hypothetical protein